MQAITSLLSTLKDLGTGKLVGIFGSIVAIIIGLTYILTRGSDSEFVPLYMDLDYKDSSAITKELDARNIPNHIKADGSIILVPKEQALKLRMDFAEQGMPSSGHIIGYEIFDKTDTLGTSNFVQNINLLRALEGELARSIGSFQNVSKARVHLVMPKRELFTRDHQKPSASVVLTIKGSKSLSKDQISAITHLVSTAVKDLEPSNITIVDTSGRSLKLGSGGEDDSSYLNSTAHDFKIAHENRLKNVIEELLEQSIGIGKVRARVSADINFDRVITNSEIFDPESKVQRSVQTSEERDSTVDKSGNEEVSVATNLPNANQNGAGGSSSSNSERKEETTNFEISKTIKNHVSETGKINRLSIAVIVDGTYTPNPDTKKIEYKPRTPEELEKIKTIIKSAVGFDEKRNDVIEIANMQFVQDLSSLEEEGVENWLKDELPSLVQTFIIATVVVLVLLLVVRPIVLQAFEMGKSELNQLTAPASEEEIIAAFKEKKAEAVADSIELAGEGARGGINITNVEAQLKSSSVKVLNDLAQRFPQESLNAIRTWINADKERKI
jgi:flagellar M-ring protein FliF